MAYTNPTFCQQSEYTRARVSDELPPPPDLPPPSPSPPPPPPLPQQQQQQHSYNLGRSNPGFHYRREEARTRGNNERYCHLDDPKGNKNAAGIYQDSYAGGINERRPIVHEREVRSRYEYIIDDDDDDEEDYCHEIEDDKRTGSRASGAQTPDEFFPRNNTRSSRYGNGENANRTAINVSDNPPAVFTYQRRDNSIKTDSTRYALVPVSSVDDERIVVCQRSNSTRGRYARVPTQDATDPPILPERNYRDQQIVTRHPDDMNYSSPKNNMATQKLHEILTTPRKPRSRSADRTLSPSKRQQQQQQQQQQYVGGVVALQRVTPTGSPSGRLISGTSGPAGTPTNRRDQRQLLQESLQRGIDSSPSNIGHRGPHTSTPTKEPSARRCLPLNLDNSTSSRPRETSPSCPASNCGRQRYPSRGDSASYGVVGTPVEPPPRYGYLDGFSESIPMVTGSPRYRVVPTDEKSVESAFIARTAVVPPLSPPHSEANTTLASGMEKSERRNAPLLLLLVGILTCGLALYLSWSQGRRYYLDSAAGCGACCAIAGACRSLRRAWTGLGLAGLSALSCAGLLLIAARAPRPGTPLHDVTAGALCGVSLLGAALALIALISPKCNFARHRRVHSWIPRFSP